MARRKVHNLCDIKWLTSNAYKCLFVHKDEKNVFLCPNRLLEPPPLLFPSLYLNEKVTIYYLNWLATTLAFFPFLISCNYILFWCEFIMPNDWMDHLDRRGSVISIPAGLMGKKDSPLPNWMNLQFDSSRGVSNLDKHFINRLCLDKSKVEIPNSIDKIN